MIALVQQDTNSSAGGTTGEITLPVNVTPGNAVVLTHTGNSHHVTAVTGCGVTWAKARESDKVNYPADIWYGFGSTGGSAIASVTFAGSTSAGFNLSEWSGLAAADPGADSDAGTGTVAATGPVTATKAPVLYVSTLAVSAARTASGVSDGFTPLGMSGGAGIVRNVGAYRIDATPGEPATAAPSWTIDVGTPWEMTIAAFHGSDAIAPPEPPSGPMTDPEVREMLATVVRGVVPEPWTVLPAPVPSSLPCVVIATSNVRTATFCTAVYRLTVTPLEALSGGIAAYDSVITMAGTILPALTGIPGLTWESTDHGPMVAPGGVEAYGAAINIELFV